MNVKDRPILKPVLTPHMTSDMLVKSDKLTKSKSFSEIVPALKQTNSKSSFESDALHEKHARSKSLNEKPLKLFSDQKSAKSLSDKHSGSTTERKHSSAKRPTLKRTSDEGTESAKSSTGCFPIHAKLSPKPAYFHKSRSNKSKHRKLVISAPISMEPIIPQYCPDMSYSNMITPPFKMYPKRNPELLQNNMTALLEKHKVENSNVATNQVPPDHTGTRGVPGENVSFSAEDETCVCISHYANEHMNQDFDMNIEKMYKLLFNDDSSVQSKMKDLQKMTEYDAASWTDSTEGANERTLNYMIPLNANLGPKFAEVIEKQVLTTNSIAAKCYIVNCEVNNPNVPYGDKFFIMKRYCLTRCSDNVCRLRMTSEVQYRKAVWGMVKSIIEKNSREGISEYCDDLNTCLAEECAGPGVKVRKAVPSVRAGAARMPRSASQEAGSRIGSSMQFVSNNYIALILIMMAVLLLLNLILVYRLSSITSQTCPLELLNSLPQSEEGKSEWVRILAKQQDLHKKEIERLWIQLSNMVH